MDSFTAEKKYKDEAILKVIDFGLSDFLEKIERGAQMEARVSVDRRTNRPTHFLQRVMPRAGTPHYMAPEIHGPGLYDEKSDVFAVGIILFFMLTGSHPFFLFDGRDTVDNCKRRILSEEPDYRKHHEKVWSRNDAAIGGVNMHEAQRLCEAMLVKDPKRRVSAKQALAFPFIHFVNTRRLTIRQIGGCFDTLFDFLKKNRLHQVVYRLLAKELDEDHINGEIRDMFLFLDRSADGVVATQELQEAATSIGYTFRDMDEAIEKAFGDQRWANRNLAVERRDREAFDALAFSIGTQDSFTGVRAIGYRDLIAALLPKNRMLGKGKGKSDAGQGLSILQDDTWLWEIFKRLAEPSRKSAGNGQGRYSYVITRNSLRHFLAPSTGMEKIRHLFFGRSFSSLRSSETSAEELASGVSKALASESERDRESEPKQRKSSKILQEMEKSAINRLSTSQKRARDTTNGIVPVSELELDRIFEEVMSSRANTMTSNAANDLLEAGRNGGRNSRTSAGMNTLPVPGEDTRTGTRRASVAHAGDLTRTSRGRTSETRASQSKPRVSQNNLNEIHDLRQRSRSTQHERSSGAASRRVSFLAAEDDVAMSGRQSVRQSQSVRRSSKMTYAMEEIDFSDFAFWIKTQAKIEPMQLAPAALHEPKRASILVPSKSSMKKSGNRVDFGPPKPVVDLDGRDSSRERQNSKVRFQGGA